MGQITVHQLGKAYKQYPTRWSRLREWASFGRQTHHQLKWVLQDIQFTIKPGEAVGIIGVNGAGKSTLLKLITGTTYPTTGSVHMTGRVAAMLELGMGFHPDFTGRQNALMAGQLLGITTEQITQLLPEIEAFAEIGGYLDQPVRVYSSGMQMRLAFSVATAIRPDILIVDEALSVGDTYFQHKSFDRIRAFRKQGTTLLIVSHDKQAITSICDRAILLSQGRIAIEGDPETVLDYYNAMLADSQQQTVRQLVTPEGHVQTISGTGEVKLTDVSLLDESGRALEVVSVGQKVTLCVKLLCQANLDQLVVGYIIKDRLGQSVFGTNTHHHNCLVKSLKNGQNVTFLFEFDANIGYGTYSVAVAAHSNENHLKDSYEWRDKAFIFNVVNVNQKDFMGIAWLPPSVKVIKE
jgi:lipopolysaccharide transport system ATP-binding protein